MSIPQNDGASSLAAGETARSASAGDAASHAAPTPGPWSVAHFADDEVDCDCAYVLSEAHFGSVAKVSVNNGKPIADGGNDCPGLEEAKANAHLIAAAPDLLAACKEFVRKCDTGHAQSTRSYAEMLAAIAKAEGR